MKHTKTGALTLSAVLSLLVAGCEYPETTNGQSGQEIVWPAVDISRFRDENVEQRIDALLSRMTLEEKVGQIIQADNTTVTPEDVRDYNLGSILSGGNSAPGDLPYATADEWVAAADAYFDASLDDSDGGVAIPLIWGIDAVHGHNNVIGGTIFPHNVGLGAMNNPDLVREIMTVTARELRVTGHDWTFAPTLAVPRDNRWGRSYEGFGEIPEMATKYARPIVEGVQGAFGETGFLGSSKIIASAKHFIADGGTKNGVDQGDAEISEQELRDIHGLPYIEAIDAGVQSVMASFSSWNARKIHGHEGLLNGVLKQKIGFDGFVVGDWNAHGQVEGCTNESCPQSINAGVDMFMAPDSWRGLYENTLKQVRSGEISTERLDDAVRRILRVKVRAGLFEAKRPSERYLAGDESQLGSAEHRQVARQAVRESLVLLKNNQQVLPLQTRQHVLVVGEKADSVSSQAGGWTLTWQGGGLDNSLFPNADTILDGIRSAVEADGGSVEYSTDGSYSQTPDVAIVVFGEQPYAEFQGDIETLMFQDELALAQLTQLKADGVKTVSVFTSGRPMWVNPLLNVSDAFVAAWWPGSEGAGIADVIFRASDNEIDHDFKGRLSFSWPRTPDQVSLNFGDRDYNPLFAYGYGLSYGDAVDVPQLSEDAGSAGMRRNKYVFFDKGRAAQPWQLASGPYGIQGSDAPSAGPSLKSIDKDAQEDAITITWQDDAPGYIGFSTSEPVDLFREMNGAMEFEFEYRVEVMPTGRVMLGAECAAGSSCSGAIDITSLITSTPPGEWRRSRISLSCLGQAGADMRDLVSPFVLTSEGALQLSLSLARAVEDEDGREACG